jgi:hypothetical protein
MNDIIYELLAIEDAVTSEMQQIGAVRNQQLHEIAHGTNFLKCSYADGNGDYYMLNAWPDREKIRVRIKNPAGKWYESSSEQPLSIISDLFRQIRSDLGTAQQPPG